MSRRETIGEIAACVSFLVLMFILLVFGSAIIPYQPSPDNEEVLAEARQ